MDYKEYESEDLLLDRSFRNYCLGNDAADVAFWEKWILLHPERYEIVEQAKQLYLLVNGNHTAEQYQKDLANFTAIFDERLSRSSIVPLTKTPVVSRRRLKPIRYWAGAAAAATIFVALVAIWVHRPGNTSASQARIAAYTSASQAGERRPFLLPDGSRVLLNASSHVTVLAGFGDTSREVSLTGEAYFDVAKDVNRPFVIHTATIDVRVLGTAFNVKAYPGDKLTETSLIKGSIEVLVKGGVNRKIILRPSEKISIPTQAAASDGKAMRTAGQNNHCSRWKNWSCRLPIACRWRSRGRQAVLPLMTIAWKK